MKPGGDPRRRAKAATALVALALLPVALMAVAHVPTVSSPTAGGPWSSAVLRAQDADLPSVEAAHRSESSSLFAPFAWDGLVASGPFLRFDYLTRTGAFLNYAAVNGSHSTVIVDSIEIQGFAPFASPLVLGATFTSASSDVMVVAHDEPMALLEIRTLGSPQNVTFQFPADTSGLQVSRATVGPASSVSFTDGNDSGRVIVAHGDLSVSGTTVSASLAATDFLALRAVPKFVEHAAERTAVLDAFASGRLAAELDFVAVSTGGWLENTAQFHPIPSAVDSSVQFSRVAVSLGLAKAQGGLVVLAFDPRTMPADVGHRLVVRSNGSDVAETSDPFASLLGLPGSSERPAYVRLPMNATVLAVYVPDLSSVSLQVSSVAVPPPGLDRPTQLAIVAGMFVVAVAAAVMFRRKAV